MSAAVRFAPSPTGLIHIGNARTALINWLFARKTGARYILRFDDTDAERSSAEFARAIEEDLAWLGIHPDEIHRQSERANAHAAAAEALKKSGRLYACYESADELERKRARQRARGLPPVYDRAGLKLSDEDRARLEGEGRKPHWRFLLEPETVEWDDLVRGPQHIDAGSLSDPVLIRADGSYLYTLPSVVDDIDLGISHVIRGEDHVANTAVQIQLFEALGAAPPRFGHHGLLTGADGSGLSKRLGSLSIASFRADGLEPMAVASLAALIGTSEAVAPHQSMEELAALFDLSKLSRAPARFDPAELAALNARLLHGMDYETVRPRLAELGLDLSGNFWNAVRGNLERLADAGIWADVIGGEIAPVIADADYCETAAELLPGEPWDDESWKVWTGALKEKTGRRGKELFQPLRLALTGLDRGPDMAALFPLLGRSKSAARLRGSRA
jgi:glutamyl-tRNA synthetase